MAVKKIQNFLTSSYVKPNSTSRTYRPVNIKSHRCTGGRAPHSV